MLVIIKGLFLSLVSVNLVICEGLIINCQFYKIPDLEEFTCKASKIIIDKPYTRITEFQGTFAQNYKAKDVKVLAIESQLVIYLPQSYKAFPNLNTLWIEDCRQKFLLESDFLEIPKLEYIHLKLGLIQRIHPKTFDKSPHLWHILIENHQIQTLPKGIFHKLPNLKFVSFFKNKIEILEGNLFQFNKKLKNVKFNENKIQFIGLELFDNFIRQPEVWLQDNDCIDVRTPSKSIKAMKEYILDNCRIMPIIATTEVSDRLPSLTSEDPVVGFERAESEEEIEGEEKTESTSLETESTSLETPTTCTNSFKRTVIVLSIIIALQSVALIIFGVKHCKKV